MTINYICEGFDKNFYNFDAVVVPVSETSKDKNKKVAVCQPYYFDDFRDDLREIVKGLSLSEFDSDRIKVVKAEKTGIYYVFVMIRYLGEPYARASGIASEVSLAPRYIFCCENMVKCINNLDVENILIHPTFNQVNFNSHRHADMDIDFLARTLKSNIDRFSKKNIYIGVHIADEEDRMASRLISRMERGVATYEECMKIFVERQAERSLSYTHRLLRIAEIETKYKPQTIARQFRKDMNNFSLFFDEYLKKYQGTDAELARNANISPSTISKIKSHEYETQSRSVVIALAIALDLTVDDRKRFINSAGFSYPITKRDLFIEQQLRKKRYTSVISFNKDIMDEYPHFVFKRGR